MLRRRGGGGRYILVSAQALSCAPPLSSALFSAKCESATTTSAPSTTSMAPPARALELRMAQAMSLKCAAAT
eukprot:2756981-Prymnesium_polylepis.1